MTKDHKSKIVRGRLEIIYRNGFPYGIRDDGGFLFFFTEITRYTGQEERFKRELAEKHELAEYLLKSLKEIK